MTERGLRAVEIAQSWIGTPYRHQASARGAGSDCLGLLRGVWRELYGAEPEKLPAYTRDWSEPASEETLWLAATRHLVSCDRRAPVRAGQVLLFRMRDRSVAKHLGLAAGQGQQMTFIHAYSGHGVIESPLSLPWRRRVVARFEFP